MYTREERMKAVDLYIKHKKNATPVILALGYPARKSLPRWYKIYMKEKETGILHDGLFWLLKYPLEKRKYAVDCCQFAFVIPYRISRIRWSDYSFSVDDYRVVAVKPVVVEVDSQGRYKTEMACET